MKFGDPEHLETLRRMHEAANGIGPRNVTEFVQDANDRIAKVNEALARVALPNRPDPAPGNAFRVELERRVTAHEEHEQQVRSAPDEVVHRRVAGRTVIARRLLARRTTT